MSTSPAESATSSDRPSSTWSGAITVFQRSKNMIQRIYGEWLPYSLLFTLCVLEIVLWQVNSRLKQSTKIAS